MRSSLVIATYDQPGPLEKVFQGLARQKTLPAEILIADDGSDDTTREIINCWRQKLSVPVHHHWQADRGFLKTKILNRAVAAATGDYLIFLDGDCVPHPRFIADHHALAEPGFWVQGRRSFVRETFAADFVPGQTSILQWILRGRISRAHKCFRLPVPFVLRNQKQRGTIGCNMAFWRDDLIAVNGFDEDYLGRGMGADSDLAARLYNLGRWRKLVYGRALVLHLDHPSLTRTHQEHNYQRLQNAIHSKKIRCETGLDQYLQKHSR